MFKDLRPYPELGVAGPPWARVLPNHWTVGRGKTLFRREQRPPMPGDGVVTCFRDGIVTLRSRRRTTGFTEALQEIGYQGVRRGDLVIHAMDAFAGAAGVSDSDGKCSPVYAVCTPLAGAEPPYFAAVVREMARSNWIAALSRGVRERSTDFRYEAFAAEQFPVPPRDEQAAIVKYLAHAHRRIDRVVDAKRRLTGLLEEEKQAVIAEAVTRGLDALAPMKDSGSPLLGPVPSHWAVVRLKNVARVVSRTGYPDAPLLSVYLGRGVIDYRDDGARRVHAPSEDLSGYQFVRRGDFVLNNQQAWRGSVGVSVTEGIVSPAYVVLEIRSELIPEYRRRLLESKAMVPQYLAASKGVGDIQRQVHKPTLMTSIVPIPPAPEQAAIVAHIERETATVNAAIDRARREISLLGEFRTRLTSDVVTGQVDVRHIAATLPDLDPDDLAADVGGEGDDLDDEVVEILEDA